MTTPKKRRPSDLDPGGRRDPYPQNENQRGAETPSKQCRRLDSDAPRGPRKPRGYNSSRRSYDRRSPRRGKVDSYRPRQSRDSYRPPRSGDSYRPRMDSYRPDSSRPSRAAENTPVSSRAEDSVRRRGRSPHTRSRQQEASDGGDEGHATRQSVADHKDRNGITKDAHGWSPRSDGRAGSQKLRDSHSRSPLSAGKATAAGEHNGKPGSNAGAGDPPESSLAGARDSSKFSPTKDSPALQPERYDSGQLTEELTSLGEDNSITDSVESQPDNNVPRPKGREESPEGTSRSGDLRSSSRHSLCSQREGGITVFGEPRGLRILRNEIPIPKLEPEDFLPNSTSADGGGSHSSGTHSEPFERDPGSAPVDSSWRYTDFTHPICELVHGRAQQAKNRASASLLPYNVPLFLPKIRRSKKPKSGGSHEGHSDKEKKECVNDPALPTASGEDDDQASSSSSEEEDCDSANPKNPTSSGGDVQLTKSQRAATGGGTRGGTGKCALTGGAFCACCVQGDSTQSARPNEPQKDPALSKVQQKNPSKSKAQAGSENGPLTKDTLSPSGVPNGSITPTKRLAMARGKQLRPEIVQALALLRASRSNHPEGEHEGGHLRPASEGLSIATLGLPDWAGDEIWVRMLHANSDH